MKKLLAFFCICLGLVIVGQSRLNAQNYLYATGNPTFSTQIPIENGFINVNNGEIHIEIPLAQHQQRGRLKLNERLVYDSRIWKIVQNSGYSWSPTNVPNSMGGWVFASGIESGTVSYLARGGTVYCYGDIYYTTFYQFTWTDPQGTQHQFPDVQTLGDISQRPPNCTQSTSIGVTAVPSASGVASDGSGYTIIVTNDTDVVIIDKYGNTYYPSVTDGGGTVAGQSLVSDTNGNYWSVDSNGNLVDTLGRTPVLVTSSGNKIYYDVLGWNGARNRYTVTTESVAYKTAFGQEDVTDASGSFTVIQSIQLPDLSTYSFGYDSGGYGELTSVTLPSGGTIQYTYTNFLDSFQNENRWLNTRVKDGGTTTFTPATITNCTSSAGCQEKTTVTSPAGNDTVYTFTLDKGSIANAASWNTGVDVYQGSSTNGAKLKSVATQYTYNTGAVTILGSGSVSFTYEYPTGFTTTTTLPDVSLSSQEVVTLDPLGADPATDKIWDYYSSSGSAPSIPLQETDYTYAPGTAFPSQITVKDGSGNQVSQTTYTYDETTGSGHAALVTTSGLPNHNSTIGTRENLTTIAQQMNASGGTISTEAEYDDTGTALNSTDPNGVTSYGHDTTDTFTTSVTPPTPSSGVVLKNSAAADVNSGLMTSQTDPNGTQIAPQVYDAFGRATQINVTNGGTTYAESTYTYTPTQSSEHDYQNASTYADTETQYDSYGRISRVAVANGQSTHPWYQSDTCYDGNGNIDFTSYAYQGNEWNTAKVCSGDGAGDSYAYDALGRLTKVTHADGTAINYTYTGRATKVVDENGVTRISQVDGLGRQTSVCEVSSSALQGASPAACGQDISATGFSTSYSYNLASHTTTVTQGSQTRTFQTDWLGRPTSVQEPERGTTTYSYSYNSTGLVVTRQRPQANQTNPSVTTTTTYQYDAVGRLTKKSYSDGEGPVLYGYDSASVLFDPIPANSSLAVTAHLNNSVGRLAWTCHEPAAQNSCITQDAFSYDAMGRVAGKWSSTPSYVSSYSPVRTQAYSYDWMGNLLTSADGAGVTTTNNYTPANEIQSITSSMSDATHPGTLISNVVNGPNGPVSWQYGNGLFHANQFDSLGRHVGWFDCSGSSQTNCTGGTEKYGYWRSIQGQQVAEVCTGPCATYQYDDFNRVKSRSENTGKNGYTYTYDRYGNRWQQTPLESGLTSSISFNPATNQINTAGYIYDAAGNLMADGIDQYTYDAEGNLIQEVSPSDTTTYTYDALNRQIRANFKGSGNVIEMLFNPNGQIASLWWGLSNNNTAIFAKAYWGTTPIESYVLSKNMAYFQFRDGSGSDVEVTDAQGNVTMERTYLPFGDGLTVTSGSRDNSFDGYTGLWDGGASSTNHAQYREYGNTQGRWLSPDPYDGSYDFTNPQSLNRYSYVTNNPLSFTDPTGQLTNGNYCGDSCGDGGAVAGLLTLGIGALIDGLEDLFGGPSFHGSLKPRPNGTGNPNWDGNFGESLGIPTYLPQQDWGIAPALGLPDAGCEFGSCGAGPSSFQAAGGAIAGTIVCQIAEPCGAVEDGALILGTIGVVGYDIYKFAKGGRQNVSDTGIESEARQLAKELNVDICTALRIMQSQTRDSARLQKIKATQKAFGCRNSSAQR